MSSSKHSLYKRSRSAFTIIELLVAISITAVIATMMVTIVTNVLGAWSRSSATLSVGNQARFIFDQVAMDLQGAVLKNSSDVTFAATIPRDQTGVNGGKGDANYTSAMWNGASVKPGEAATPPSLVLNPTDRDLEAYRFGQAGVWLRFFTVPSDDNSSLSNRSAPRAVSYQISRRQVGSTTAPYTYQLFRAEVRPYGTNAATKQTSTFTQGYDLFGANGYNGPDDPLGNGGTSAADAGTIRRPRAEYVLGNGVVDFGVRIFTRSTAGVLEEAFPVDRRGGGAVIRRVFATTTDTTKLHPSAAPYVALASGNFASATTSYGVPAVVEVMMRILTPEGLQILQAYEEDPTRYGGASAAKWWELVEANSKVFVRRIEIKSTAL